MYLRRRAPKKRLVSIAVSISVKQIAILKAILRHNFCSATAVLIDFTESWDGRLELDLARYVSRVSHSEGSFTPG